MPTDVVARPYASADRASGLATPDAVTAAFVRFAALDDGPVKERLQEELMRAWLPMAHRLAARFRDRGESHEDLRQVAALGLLKAIRRFDPARGPFEPFAIPTIRGEIRRHFRDRTWGVRVPRRIQELRNQVRAAYVELALTPGSPCPTVADVARHTGLCEDEVRDGMEALESYRALSLDAPNGDTGGEAEGPRLADALGEPDHAFDLVVDRESVKEAVRRLPSRERAILYLRFFEDWSQSRIADRMGISQMHVSRLLSRTCARIRQETLDPS
ncbi:SigB/SigF/SigG family RNA polymerase sigma factor [Streptomyces sp. TRM S81-3]|uniref:SigB/SigF/SigG family RNA polymerase sigma factor n=1 Tax=Streptomyces griseicoloratus TaxID=2752516 RepID=A0A926QPV6_9ACTN|nr:SigB/SigF/SigG family RNA polymerase sigma factor [Streptomyces griseicoloratus]MBD0418915.1 SigB/SigF/SigG family RNA polymerase sigma factor [Streptomyces griseicoloratus]